MKSSNCFFKASIGFMVALLCCPQLIQSQTIHCSGYTNLEDGSAHYASSICQQVIVDQFWNTFDMDKDYWDQGFGFEDPCNQLTPLNRTFSALFLLAYSAEDYAKKTNDFSGNALRWAYPYVATHCDELWASCYKFDIATERTGAWANSDGISLYLSFFMDYDVSMRAATLLHEARHNGGKYHYCNRSGFDTNPCGHCPRRGSCDVKWADQGANMYEVLYLWWFSVDGTRTTNAIKNVARNRARILHNGAFIQNPGFNI